MLRLLLAPIALASLLSACAEPAAAPPPALRAPAPAVVADAPEPATQALAAPPAIKRDPYESYLGLAAADDGAEARTKLERIPLDRLRLTGVVQQAAPVALLEDDTGEGHMVRIGTRVGTAGGLVTAIQRSGIVVEEHFYDPLLRTIKVEKRLTLTPAQG